MEARILFRVSDGLCGILPGECDTVVIAGMGGETAAAILEAAPWALERRLILQPATRAPHLRRWLYAHGCAIREECAVRDAGRLYAVLRAERGTAPEGELYAYASPALLERARTDEAARAYLLRTAELLEREVGRDYRAVTAALRDACGVRNS